MHKRILAAACVVLVALSPITGIAADSSKTTMCTVEDEMMVSIPYFVKTERSVEVTAYSSTPDQTDDSPFITASGTSVRDGIVAANWLPFGTKIQIPEAYGDKVFVVEDRMNKRHSERMDIWMPTRADAVKWGRRKVTVRVLQDNPEFQIAQK